MRSLSTPIGDSLIWNEGSPASTRSTSIVTFGYNVPPLSTTRGMRLVTPSTSAQLLVIPLPTAENSTSGTLAIIPGTLGMVPI